jgi:hypothetical protein
MIKEKKCLGQGIAKGYGCGKMVKVENRIYGLGKMCCYGNWLTTSENGKIKLYKALNKVQKPRLEMEKAVSDTKQRSKLKLTHERTKQIVHSFVRERDKGKPCISCGCDWKPDFQAGHFYPAGSFETLKYNLDNISGQCVQCNLYNSGNFENYSLRLPNRIGIENYQKLVKLAEIDKKASKVWHIDSLLEIQKQIKKINQ